MTDVLEQTPPEPARAPEGPRPDTPEVEAPGWIDKVAERLSSVSIEGWITFVIVVGAVFLGVLIGTRELGARDLAAIKAVRKKRAADGGDA